MKQNLLVVKLITLLLVLGFVSSIHAQPHCRCRIATESDTTRPGADEGIKILESKPRESIIGSVGDPNGNALEKVLVEVFAAPSTASAQGNRIAACFTDQKGAFCFSNVPDGKYYVLFSLDGGWKQISLSIVIARKSVGATKKRIEIYMQLGL